MCVCVYVCVYTCVRARVYERVREYVCVPMCVCVYESMCMRMYMYVHVCDVRACVCMYSGRLGLVIKLIDVLEPVRDPHRSIR